MKIGDMVTVIHPKMSYSLFQELADMMDASNFIPGDIPPEGAEGVVLDFSKHPRQSGMVVLVAVDGQDYLMAQSAVRPVKKTLKEEREEMKEWMSEK